MQTENPTGEKQPKKLLDQEPYVLPRETLAEADERHGKKFETPQDQEPPESAARKAKFPGPRARAQELQWIISRFEEGADHNMVMSELRVMGYTYETRNRLIEDATDYTPTDTLSPEKKLEYRQHGKIRRK